MTVQTYLTDAVSVVALLGVGWRILRGLARFVRSVEENTRAVTVLAGELHDHTATTTASLSALDQRVTILEGTAP